MRVSPFVPKQCQFWTYFGFLPCLGLTLGCITLILPNLKVEFINLGLRKLMNINDSVWERIRAREVREIPSPRIHVGDFNYFLSVLILDRCLLMRSLLRMDSSG